MKKFSLLTTTAGTSRSWEGRARRSPRVRARRGGFTLLEVSMSVLMLAVAMAVTAQLLGVMALERRAVERRARAVHEAANLMERLTAWPWEKLTPARASEVQLSSPALQALPGGELTVAVHSPDGDDWARRIAVQIRWRSRSGGFESPVRLTAWVYRSRSAQP